MQKPEKRLQTMFILNLLSAFFALIVAIALSVSFSEAEMHPAIGLAIGFCCVISTQAN